MPKKVIVRCSQGALYSTVWQPFVSVKALRLGRVRVQRCPVVNVLSPTSKLEARQPRRGAVVARKNSVDPASLSEAELAQAQATFDSGLP